jgi:glycopeptide antibiotics resistance protein
VSLRIFTPGLKAFWLITVLLIGVAEMFPFDNLHVRPTVFYSYELVKAAVFIGLGFEIPLTFWRFNSLNRGLIISLFSAAVIEGIQLFVRGHRFEIVELLLKGVLIMLGFTLGLMPRHNKQLSLLGLQVRLISAREAKAN